MSDRGERLLEVRGLRTEFFQGAGAVRVVDDVSFAVDAGQSIGLVGESGCGKSVTALSIMGLVDPRAGRVGGQVTFDGELLSSLPRAEIDRVRGRSLAMAFQDPMSSLNPVMTVGGQISEVLRTHLNMPRSAAKRRAVELLAEVGVPAPEVRARSYPHQLSGGMRQRVMIAMAVACSPKVLIADEITTALDVTVQAQILELLQRLQSQHGTAIVHITHDLGVVASTIDHVNVMYAGQIVETAPTRVFFSAPRMPYSWGLLRSVPRIDRPRIGWLSAIEGAPPEPAAWPEGCRFEPRCAFSRPICRTSPPPLAIADESNRHAVRCFGAHDADGGGWLRNIDWRRAEVANAARRASEPAG